MISFTQSNFKLALFCKKGYSDLVGKYEKIKQYFVFVIHKTRFIITVVDLIF